MPSFNETLERMKSLYTYGKEMNESKNLKTHTLEHRAVAADGITYGIIREGFDGQVEVDWKVGEEGR